LHSYTHIINRIESTVRMSRQVVSISVSDDSDSSSKKMNITTKSATYSTILKMFQ
jgi:hypothetical protein